MEDDRRKSKRRSFDTAASLIWGTYVPLLDGNVELLYFFTPRIAA
jgi:hypothetical protein